MHNFPVLRKYGSETCALCQTAGNAVHLTTDETFRHAGLDEQLCRRVHHVTDVASTVYSVYFLLFLRRSLLHHRLNEFQRGSILLLRGVYAQQVHDLYLRVVTVGWQEMNRCVCRCVTTTY